MINFSKVQSPTRLVNKDFVLSRITDAMIFGYYFGPFKIGDKYPSKFRKDRNPSTGFYVSSKSNKLIYNDLKTAEKLDAFDFVQKLYGCSFQDAVTRVATDFGLVTGKVRNMDMNLMKKMMEFDKEEAKEYKKIQWMFRKHDAQSIEFWKSYHITREEIRRERVFQIDRLFINDYEVPNKDNELRFALTIPRKGEEALSKIYAPTATDNYRFVSNIPNALPFGLNTLIPGSSKKLFITKAVKDKIIVQKFFPAVIASQNESSPSIPDALLEKFHAHFDEIFVLWDNDETGLHGMKEMEKRGCKGLHLPVSWLEHGLKDYSDLAKSAGLGSVENFFKKHKLL